MFPYMAILWEELGQLLKVDAGDLLDCRLAKSPKLAPGQDSR